MDNGKYKWKFVAYNVSKTIKPSMIINSVDVVIYEDTEQGANKKVLDIVDREQYDLISCEEK